MNRSNDMSHDQQFLAKYLSLEQPSDKVILTYVFIHPGNVDKQGNYYPQLVDKVKVVDFVPKSVDEVPEWDSGMFTPGGGTDELIMKPVRLYKDPFRRGNNLLVLCDTYDKDMKPLESNTRYSCQEVMDRTKHERPWFGFEQEYVLLDGNTKRPLGWPHLGFPQHTSEPEGWYAYCVGANRVFGRDVVEAHLRACLYAGITIGGINAESLPSQWEYQVGPCEGIRIGDDVLMSRYVLHRIAEERYIEVTFDPKPVPHWFGGGGHMNFSSEAMRQKDGLRVIEKAIERLAANHDKHIARYDPRGGEDNRRRLVGSYGAPTVDEFTSGVAVRSTSVRIPRRVAIQGFGYLEDRRPASNCDPYVVSELLVRTCCLQE